jgi:hypothetical protein
LSSVSGGVVTETKTEVAIELILTGGTRTLDLPHPLAPIL